MKTKRLYTAPVTERAIVELEGGFCGSIQDNSKAESTGHETTSASKTLVDDWNTNHSWE